MKGWPLFAFVCGLFAEVPLSTTPLASPRGEAVAPATDEVASCLCRKAAAVAKTQNAPGCDPCSQGRKFFAVPPCFARATSRWGPCRLRQRRCLQPDAVTGVPGAGLGQPPLAGATLRPCSASCSPPVSTIGALWLRQCQKLTLLFLVFVWFFIYVHHYSVATPLCQWVRSAKSSRVFAVRAGYNP